MKNYEYIVASLPVLSTDWKYGSSESFESILGDIREQLSKGDNAVMDFLLNGFDENSLNEEFYFKALRHPNRFIREYFRFDLNLRNAKVRFLNKSLGRPADEDVMTGLGKEDDTRTDIDGYLFTGGEFEEALRTDAIFSGGDLLQRERALDDLKWGKINELTVFDDFDMEAILAFVAKLKIVDRWLTLDEEQGKEMFKRLVDEVRGTFKGVNYQE